MIEPPQSPDLPATEQLIENLLRLARACGKCGLSELSDGRRDTVKTHPPIEPRLPVVAVLRTEAILESPHETQRIIEVGYVHAHHFPQNRLLGE
jgi:hypothetical protein